MWKINFLFCFAVCASCLFAKTLWITLCNVNNWLYINYQLSVCVFVRLFVAPVAPCSRSCPLGRTVLRKLLTLFWKLSTGDAQKCDWRNHTWGNPIAHRKPSLGGNLNFYGYGENPVGKKFIAQIYCIDTIWGKHSWLFCELQYRMFCSGLLVIRSN